MDKLRVKEILKSSLSINGDKFNKTIDSICDSSSFNRFDFRGDICFYFDTNLIILLSKNLIKLNSNFLCLKWFEVEYGRRYNHFDSSLNSGVNFKLDTKELKYNESLSDVLSDLRSKKINKILNNEI